MSRANSVSPRVGPTGSGRSVNHVSRACLTCKRRKRGCDGKGPICQSCAERNLTCEWPSEQDGRSTFRRCVAEVNAKLDALLATRATSPTTAPGNGSPWLHPSAASSSSSLMSLVEGSGLYSLPASQSPALVPQNSPDYPQLSSPSPIRMLSPGAQSTSSSPDLVASKSLMSPDFWASVGLAGQIRRGSETLSPTEGLKRSRTQRSTDDAPDAAQPEKFTCKAPGCGRAFGRMEHLRRHVRSIHINDKPHACPHKGCKRRFARTDNLWEHAKTHMGGPGNAATNGTPPLINLSITPAAPNSARRLSFGSSAASPARGQEPALDSSEQMHASDSGAVDPPDVDAWYAQIVKTPPNEWSTPEKAPREPSAVFGGAASLVFDDDDDDFDQDDGDLARESINTSSDFRWNANSLPPSFFPSPSSYARHLPATVRERLSLAEHDALLHLFFIHAAPWQARIIPWMFVRDMHAALAGEDNTSSQRRAYYSPALHNALLAEACGLIGADTWLFARDIREHFARQARELLAQEMKDKRRWRAPVSLLQALALLGHYHLGITHHGHLASMYYGLAFRLARAKDFCHIPPESQDEDSAARAVLCLSLYCQDVEMAVILGCKPNGPLTSLSSDIGMSLLAEEMQWDFAKTVQPLPASAHVIATAPVRIQSVFRDTRIVFTAAHDAVKSLVELRAGEGMSRVHSNAARTTSLFWSVASRLQGEAMGQSTNGTAPPTLVHQSTPHQLLLYITSLWLRIVLSRESAAESSLPDATQIVCNLQMFDTLYGLHRVQLTAVYIVSTAGKVFLRAAEALAASNEERRRLLDCADNCRAMLDKMAPAFPIATEKAHKLCKMSARLRPPVEPMTASSAPPSHNGLSWAGAPTPVLGDAFSFNPAGVWNALQLDHTSSLNAPVTPSELLPPAQIQNFIGPLQSSHTSLNAPISPRDLLPPAQIQNYTVPLQSDHTLLNETLSTQLSGSSQFQYSPI